MKVLCDVTLDENEPDKEEEKSKAHILSAKYFNSTTLLVKFDTKMDDNETIIVEISSDKIIWHHYKVSPGGYVFLKEKGTYLKMDNSNDVIEIQNTDVGQEVPTNANKACMYKGRLFEFGEEYNDDCSALCVCGETGKLLCST